MDCQWVIFGSMGGMEIEKCDLKKLFVKRINLHFSTLKSRSNAYKADLIKDFSKDILPAIEKGEIKPIINKTFKLSEVSEAHKHMEGNKNIGKIVCTNDL